MSKTGLKHDSGKPAMDLIPWSVMVEVGRVLNYGAQTYGSNNWKLVETWRYLGAAFRHMAAYTMGEKYDKETGFHHMAHAICCCLFAAWHDLGKEGECDRPPANDSR